MIIRAGIDDLDLVGFDYGGSEIFHYKGQPFTGILETLEDGIVVSEEEFQNGYKEGLQRRFYLSGKRKLEFSLHDNGLNGLFKKWNEGGELISQSNWKDGEKLL